MPAASHDQARSPTFARGPRARGGERCDGAPLLAPGTTFARYVISHCIGRGGMGTVYEARHAVLNKRVALKTLHDAPGRDGALRDRFLQEAELAARVRHPHVVDIHDAGVEDGVAFLVMELLEGEDLAQHLAREGRLLAREAVDVIVPVIAGLAELHRLGIAHRDVKPENIFLAYDPHGRIMAKLVDFGISKDFAEPGRSSHTQCVPRERGRRPFEGTPHYMAPEQMRGEVELDPRSDQYALGVVLYQCLSGVLPYQGGSLLDLAYRVCSGEHTPLSSLRPDLPRELLEVVACAMSVDVEKRFASMAALGQALLPFASPELGPLLAHVLASGGLSSLPARRPSSLPPRAPGRRGACELAEAPTLPHHSDRRDATGTRGHAWGLVFALGLALSGFYALQHEAGPSAEAQRQFGAGAPFEHVLLGELSLPF